MAPYLLLALLCIAAGILLESRATSPPNTAADLEDRSIRLALLAILGTGLAVRAYGIDFGLPHIFHADEPRKVQKVLSMLRTGDLNPHYFLHPSLLLHSTAALIKLREIVSGSSGDTEAVLLAGRTVSAVAGTASIYFVFQIGRRLFSPASGLLAAVVMAMSPLTVTCSRYMKEDTLFLCLALASVATMVGGAQRKQPWRLAVAGFLAGLSAAGKYTGAITPAFLVFAPFLASRSWRPEPSMIGPTLFAIALAPLGFAAGAPFSWIDAAAFLEGVRSERDHMLQGHNIPIDPWSQFWMYHGVRSITPALTLPIAMASAVGLGALLRRDSAVAWLPVFGFLLYYLPAEWVRAKPAPQAERYILPCIPFLAIAFAELVRLVGVRSRRTALVFAGVAAAFLTVSTVRLAAEIPNDTRDRLLTWMRDNVDEGTRVLYLQTPTYYPIFGLAGLPSRSFSNADVDRVRPEAIRDSFRASNADLLVMSSLAYQRFLDQPNVPPLRRARYEAIFDQLPLVVEIAPDYRTYGFHNPTLRAYRLR